MKVSAQAFASSSHILALTISSMMTVSAMPSDLLVPSKAALKVGHLKYKQDYEVYSRIH